MQIFIITNFPMTHSTGILQSLRHTHSMHFCNQFNSFYLREEEKKL